MVFIGGNATGLLITDTAAPPVRETRDVDVIVEVTSHADYYTLAGKLRARGFSEDQSDGAPLRRWVSGELILDVMPTDSKILGFSNTWHPSAIRASVNYTLPNNRTIKITTAPCFLATKIEAFYGRGHLAGTFKTLLDNPRIDSSLLMNYMEHDNEPAG